MSAPVRLALPAATSLRWQPLRCGLLNLFKYDREEFRFERGRLLLRGNNGTGKSRVLALTLPFLFDGETASHRLEPDGDVAKRMSWNLLMDRHDERAGYTWLELGRVDEEGVESYLTLGCGLRATRGRSSVETWFFMTPQRIGKELFLVSASGAPLGRASLNEHLAGHALGGRMFKRAQDYRRAIDEELFQLGTERYEALLRLLIELRKPQLSRKLDEERLNRALSEALAPLSETVLGQVAEAFRGLEEERQSLLRYQGARDAVAAFLEGYRNYVQIAARRRAGELCATQALVAKTARLAEVQRRRLEAVSTEVALTADKHEALRGEELRAQERERALRESPSWQEAAQLERVEQEAARASAAAEHAQGDAARAGTALEQANAELALAEEEVKTQRAILAQAAEGSQEAADVLGIREHTTRCEPLGLPDPEPTAPLATVREAVSGSLSERREHAEHLAELDAKVGDCERDLAESKLRQQHFQSDLDRALDREAEAHARLQRAGEELLVAFRSWGARLEVLGFEDLDALADALRAWSEAPEGAAPLVRELAEARDRAADLLLREGSQRRAEEAEVQARHELLVAEQRELRAGRHAPPRALPGREHPGRQDRPGAPLWRVVDFRPELDAAQRAGLEAALEAAGLLDAWISPGGELLRRDQSGEWEHDAALVIGRSPRPAREESLERYLVPAIDPADPQASELEAELVAEVLRHVGGALPSEAGAGEVWVSCDGRYQAGPLHGAWGKTCAEHVGAGAREERRRARLAELEGLIQAERAELARSKELQAALAQRSERLKGEQRSCPSSEPVREASLVLDTSRLASGEARTQLETQEALVLARRQELSSQDETRRVEADALGLTVWIRRGEALRRSLDAFGAQLERLWSACSLRVAAGKRRTRAESARAQGRGEAAQRAELARLARDHGEQASERARTLREAVGADVARLHAELAEASARVATLRGEVDEAQRRQGRTEKEEAVARSQLEHVGELQTGHEVGRDRALERWGTFARAGLLAVAGLDLGDTVDASPAGAVAAAEATERALAAVSTEEAAWERAQKSVHRHVQDLTNALLPHGYQPNQFVQADVYVVSVPYQGRSLTPLELEEALADEVFERQRLLSAREREVIENHLVGEVATHLHERLREAEGLVADMNQELARCPTSTGVELKFSWDPLTDGPAGLGEARTRLLSAGATWSLEDREALGDFLQERIEAVRQELSEGAGGTWQEALRRALDYRSWHRFSILRRQEGQWRRLTRRTHGTGSGGEKAIALTIPQLAAAAAHYRSAGKHAPRLILLDEAFVGVDADMRAKCMGLMEAFELDFVMTSEREWGCYPTLSGLSICQLATSPGVDAVFVTRWVWNGRERVRDETPISPAQPLAPSEGSSEEPELPLLQSGPNGE